MHLMTLFNCLADTSIDKYLEIISKMSFPEMFNPRETKILQTKAQCYPGLPFFLFSLALYQSKQFSCLHYPQNNLTEWENVLRGEITGYRMSKVMDVTLSVKTALPPTTLRSQICSHALC